MSGWDAAVVASAGLDAANAPSPYLRPKLARLLRRTQREFADLIDTSPAGGQLAVPPIGSDVFVVQNLGRRGSAWLRTFQQDWLGLGCSLTHEADRSRS